MLPRTYQSLDHLGRVRGRDTERLKELTRFDATKCREFGWTLALVNWNENYQIWKSDGWHHHQVGFQTTICGLSQLILNDTHSLFMISCKDLMEIDWTPWLNSQDPPPSEGHPGWHPCCFSRLPLPAGLSQQPLPRHHVQYLQAVPIPSPSCPNSTTVGQRQAPRLCTAEKYAKTVMPSYFWHHPCKSNSIYSAVLIAILNRDQRKTCVQPPPTFTLSSTPLTLTLLKKRHSVPSQADPLPLRMLNHLGGWHRLLPGNHLSLLRAGGAKLR